MALFAGGQLALTAVGIWYIRKTLVETEKAVKEAASATGAAQAAVEVTREAAEKQMRAHVLLEDTVAGGCYGYPPKEAAFIFKIANRGQSPAWITGISTQTLIGSIPDTPPSVPPRPYRMIVVAPGSVTTSLGEDLEFPEGFTWDETVYVFGSVQYRDVYADRETTFLFKLILHGGHDGTDRMVPWGGPEWWTYT